MNIVPVARLRSEFGLLPAADPIVTRVLGAEGLIVAGGVDGAKLSRVRSFLGERFAVSCGHHLCDEMAPAFAGPTVVPGPASRCIVCAGSVNERARKRVLLACRRSGIRRIVVVGGSPRSREELHGDYLEHFADGTRRGIGIEWRLVDGIGKPNDRDARANVARADIVVIWATTQLDHKTSILNVNGRHPRTVTCAQRSVAALCDAIVRNITGDARPSALPGDRKDRCLDRLVVRSR